MKNRLYFALFPRKCASCGSLIPRERFYCETCRAKLPFIEGERCPLCGVQKEMCSCDGHKKHYESIAAPFYYEGGARRALLRLKKYPIYAEALAADCVQVLNSVYATQHFDYITSVPMSKKRKRQAGFNHSEALAKQIALLVGIPYKELLQVVMPSEQSQHNLPFDLREGNVRGTFDLLEPEPVKDQIILIVDDIKTSGATLDECARMLKLYDARSVMALTVAISTQNKPKTTQEKEDGFRN